MSIFQCGCTILETELICPRKCLPADLFSALPRKSAISNAVQLVFTMCYDGQSYRCVIILLYAPLFVLSRDS